MSSNYLVEVLAPIVHISRAPRTDPEDLPSVPGVGMVVLAPDETLMLTLWRPATNAGADLVVDLTVDDENPK